MSYSTYVYGTVISLSKDDLGGYTGSSPNIDITCYPANSIDYYYYYTQYAVDKINKAYRRINDRKGLITTEITKRNGNPIGFIATTYTYVHTYSTKTITFNNFKINVNPLYSQINASNQLEVKSTLLNPIHLKFNASNQLQINPFFFNTRNFIIIQHHHNLNY